MNFGGIITIISLLLMSVFIFSFVLFFRKAKKIKSEKTAERSERGEKVLGDFKENWEGVLSHMNSASESDWKLAVMEADKIVDRILLLKGYKGESMAERMTSIDKEELESIELLWEAHKVRNRIAHKPGFRLDYNQAKKIVSYYEEVLNDLRAL